MRDKNSFGYFISKRRKYMRMTQEELAEKVGVSKSAIAKWETNGGLPDRDNLKKLAEVINVSIDDLHRIISRSPFDDMDMIVNITPDVITALESFGYKVIRPGKEKEE